jgi:hypothetical protein
MSSIADPWVAEVQLQMEEFASRHRLTYKVSQRELAASFEIGCLHSLLALYGAKFQVYAKNLQPDGSFRYLTSPNGNPANFSYIALLDSSDEEVFHVRQQVRIRSIINDQIAFTPDLVVLPAVTEALGQFDPDYANGKRRFFSVDSNQVVAAHECKSMNPFPELLVGFLGMLISAHVWLDYPHCRDLICEGGLHLAPTLFVGGAPSVWHSRMVSALSDAYPINVVTGMHAGTWNLAARGVNMFNVRPALYPESEVE